MGRAGSDICILFFGERGWEVLVVVVVVVLLAMVDVQL